MAIPRDAIDPGPPQQEPPSSALPLPTPWFPAPATVGGSDGAYRSDRRELTFGAESARRAVIYGKCRVGGHVFGVGQDGSGDMHVGFGIGEGPITSVEDTVAYGGTGAPWITYSHHLGIEAGETDATFQTALGGAVETYPFLAWSHLTYDVSLLGDTQLEFPMLVVKGLSVYDPRENRLTYSESGLATEWTFSPGAPTIAANANEFGYTGNQTSAALAAGAWKWTFGVGGPYTAYRSTSGLALTTADPLIVSAKLSVASGTASVNLKAIKVTGSETTTTACSVTTTPTRFYAIVSGGGSGSGEGRVQIDAIPNSTALIVEDVVIQKQSSFYGYKKTAASAFTPSSAYSANPALEMADIKTHHRYGQRVSVRASFSGTGLDDIHVYWNGSGTIGTYDVVIDGTGSPNTFKWRKDGGAYTTGVAITGGNQQLGSNGAYVRFGALTGHTNNDAWSIIVPADRIDWTTVGVGAAYCDEVLSDGNPRFECHIALRETQSVDEWMRAIGLHCAGRWQWSVGSGKWILVIHRPSASAFTVTTAHIIGTPKCKRGATGTIDMPNRVTVKWTDIADDYKTKSLSVDGSGRDDEETREGDEYPLPGCVRQQQAKRTATYLLNGMLTDLEVSFTSTLALSHLYPGQRITMTDTTVGLSSRDFTITSISLDEERRVVNVNGLEYSASVWSDTVITGDSATSSVSYSPFSTPAEATQPKQSSGAFPSRFYWSQPRVYASDTLYATGYWSQVSLASYDGTRVNDGLTSATAFTTASNGELILDIGSSKTMGAVHITATSAGSLYDMNANTANAPIAYYWNGSSWTQCANQSTGRSIPNSSFAFGGWYIDFDSVSATKFRLLWSSSLSITADVKEVQWKEYTAATWPYVKAWEILHDNGSLIQTIPASSIPTSTSQYDVTQVSDVSYLAGFDIYTKGLIVRAVGMNDSRSTGRYFIVQSSIASEDNETGRPPLRSTGTSIAGRSSGGLALSEDLVAANVAADDKVSGKRVELTGTSTSAVVGKFNAPSSHAADIAQFMLNSTVKSSVGKTGMLKSVQASNITPFVAARVTCSTLTSLTSTTVTDITGATWTWTPDENVRLLVVGAFAIESVTTPSGDFRGRLDVDGVEDAAQARWYSSVAGDVGTVVQVWKVDLTGAASHTLKLRANLGTSSGQIDVKATHTGFVAIVVGSA